MSKPRILFLDIETSPIVSYTWGIFDQNIPLDMIKKDWKIMSIAWQWSDESKGHVMTQHTAGTFGDDRKLMKKMRQLLNQAHYVCGHNITSFDLKKIKTRMLLQGLKPPNNVQIIDTLKIARKHFAFTSNKLEHLAKVLGCKVKKLTIRKFDGFSLWDECLKNNRAAWDEMAKYNSIDVQVLQEVYSKLMPYHDMSFSAHTNGLTCTCGNNRFRKDGFRYGSKSVHQQVECTSCGKKFKVGKNLLPKNHKETSIW